MELTRVVPLTRSKRGLFWSVFMKYRISGGNRFDWALTIVPDGHYRVGPKDLAAESWWADDAFGFVAETSEPLEYEDEFGGKWLYGFKDILDLEAEEPEITLEEIISHQQGQQILHDEAERIFNDAWPE